MTLRVAGEEAALVAGEEEVQDDLPLGGRQHEAQPVGLVRGDGHRRGGGSRLGGARG